VCASLHWSVRRRFLLSRPFQFPFLGMSGRCTRALTTGDNRRVGMSGLPLLRGSGVAIFLTTATGIVSKCVKDFRILISSFRPISNLAEGKAYGSYLLGIGSRCLSALKRSIIRYLSARLLYISSCPVSGNSACV
jgi:hypothetical protein